MASGGSKTGMALLTRYLSLCDQDDTQILTFVATKSVTRDLNRDITSKEFKYVFITINVSTGVQMTNLEAVNKSKNFQRYKTFNIQAPSHLTLTGTQFATQISNNCKNIRL